MSGFSDPFIDGAAHCRIEAELDAIEREHGVRILIAVEFRQQGLAVPIAGQRLRCPFHLSPGTTVGHRYARLCGARRRGR